MGRMDEENEGKYGYDKFIGVLIKPRNSLPPLSTVLLTLTDCLVPTSLHHNITNHTCAFRIWLQLCGILICFSFFGVGNYIQYKSNSQFHELNKFSHFPWEKLMSDASLSDMPCWTSIDVSCTVLRPTKINFISSEFPVPLVRSVDNLYGFLSQFQFRKDKSPTDSVLKSQNVRTRIVLSELLACLVRPCQALRLCIRTRSMSARGGRVRLWNTAQRAYSDLKVKRVKNRKNKSRHDLWMICLVRINTSGWINF